MYLYLARMVAENVISFEDKFRMLDAKLRKFESFVKDTEEKAGNIYMKVAKINKHIMKVKESEVRFPVSNLNQKMLKIK